MLQHRYVFYNISLVTGIAKHKLKARFALSASKVFIRTNTVTTSEKFYNSILDLLEDPDEIKKVDALTNWWNQ